jgi:hypothetical protein
MHDPFRWMRSLWLLLMCLFASLNAAAEDSVLDGKLKLFKRFEANLAMPLAERVQAMPDDLLKSLIDFDQSIGIKNTDYKARILATDEKASFMDYVELLPARYRETFRNKLLAVYFVDNFAGAGMTDWLVDEQGVFYYYMILNSALLAESLDGWLTYRENSFFAGGSPFSIKIRTGTNYKALLYGLLHEGGHIVDIEYHVTPYLDEPHKTALKQESEVSDFTRGVWEGQKKPVSGHAFNNQDGLNVYGIFNRELIPGAEMEVMFRQLSRTPFVSFYAGTAWYEDFADLITYHHIERSLGGTIKAELYNGGKLVKRYSPTRRNAGGDRKKIMKNFFE